MPLDGQLTETLTNTLDKVSDVTGAKHVSRLADQARDYLYAHAAQFVGGTVVFVIGIVVTGWLAKGLARVLEKRENLEPPERLLIVMVARILMFGLTLMIALDVAGYPITAMLAGFGALAVGVGFAMQGLLSNIIAGLTLIFTKPFLVGEYIEILGTQGQVTHVNIISTSLVQLDHSRVVIPNHKIIGEVLRNFGTVRQVCLLVGIGYKTDVKQARELAQQTLAANRRVLREPEPIITVSALRESTLGFSIKFWVNVADYELAEGELNETIVECFHRNKIEMPYPRREVHIVNPRALSHE